MTDTDPGAAFEDGVLVSRRFGDVYASRAGGLAQSRAVFLAGCGLPERWAGRQRFTVAELGFGTGLNMLSLLHLWERHRPAGATLHLFSVEGFPLSCDDAARALSAFPELAGLATTLLTQWPRQRHAWHRIDFPALGATLDLALSDVVPALSGWDGRADAWFLDGFSPARNPAMWTDEVLALVGARTAPGGRAATWSAAGAVRRGLGAAGFSVERVPGFTGKRERIEARFPGGIQGEPAGSSTPRVAIVGAGIAGASLARALRTLGLRPRLFAQGPMASGNPAALVTPRLAAGSTAAAQLHAQAFLRSVALVRREAPGAIIAEGAQRLLKPAETVRAEATIASGLFPPGSLRLEGQVLHMADALTLSPERLRAAWLDEVEPCAVEAPRHTPEGCWLGAHGPFDAVVIAAGYASAALADLRLTPIRGQVTTAAIPPGAPPTSWGGYLIPTDEGLLFGATHNRGDDDPSIRAEDQSANLAGLARAMPALAGRLATEPLGAAAGIRAAAGDHQPYAGGLGSGLFTLTGLGGRGFTLAPLLAEHVSARLAGAPSPLEAASARIVDPLR